MSSNPKRGPLMAAFIITGLVGGVLVGSYVLTTPDALRLPEALRKPRTDTDAKPVEANTQGPKLLVPRNTGAADLRFDKVDEPIPPGADARVHLINRFLQVTKIANPEARAIGIDVRSGLAVLSLNKAFGESQGSFDERVLVNGILATLGQFPEIDRVQFEVDGQQLETLGNIDLSEPQAVIRATEPATDSS